MCERRGHSGERGTQEEERPLRVTASRLFLSWVVPLTVSQEDVTSSLSNDSQTVGAPRASRRAVTRCEPPPPHTPWSSASAGGPLPTA